MEISNKRIAILGATGHIARGLIYGFCMSGQHQLFLFVRSAERMGEFLKTIHYNGDISVRGFDEFRNIEYDVIINCVGVGNPVKLKEMGGSIIRLTETYDNLVLDYLEAHPNTLYIYFSSGAVYGTDFRVPADETTRAEIDINHISSGDYYRIAKMNSEAKHRAATGLNIVDLRIFGYFSRFIDLKSEFFMSEIVSCVKYGKDFVTTPINMTRDYVYLQDLLSLIEKCIDVHQLNDVFDVYSKEPVTKFEILDYFYKHFRLKYIVIDDINIASVTGSKNEYCSNNRSAQKIGYIPDSTSLDCIIRESAEILKN